MAPERNAAPQGPRRARLAGPPDHSARSARRAERELAEDTQAAARAENEGYTLGRPTPSDSPSRTRQGQ